jgi:hypothetical protein
MRRGHASTRPMIHFEQQGEVARLSHGRFTLFARIACIAMVPLTVGLFVMALPTYFAFLRKPCISSHCVPGQLSVDGAQALHSIGVSLADYAVLIVILALFIELFCVTVAGFLLWRISDNWFALLVAAMLMGLGASSDTINASLLHPVLGPTLAVPVAHIFDGLGAFSLPLIFSLFPNGRFVPRWIGLLLLAFFIYSVVYTLNLSPSVDLSILSALFFSIFGLILVYAQIYRYRKVSTHVERQQTKWVLFGFSFAMLINLGILFPTLLFPSLRQPASLYQVFFRDTIGFYSLASIIVLSFCMALLRYRLWDIDVLIYRTLVYGTLTVMLALVYSCLVLGLQSLVRVVTGSMAEQPFAIVVSTLAIAALFQPLRRRIQAVIDRRFYRRKYDAAQILEAFSETLHNEVDLNQLREQLVLVVKETMQPTFVSMWLRPPEHDEKRKSWRANSADSL